MTQEKLAAAKKDKIVERILREQERRRRILEKFKEENYNCSLPHLEMLKSRYGYANVPPEEYTIWFNSKEDLEYHLRRFHGLYA